MHVAVAIGLLLLMGAGDNASATPTDIVGLLREFGFPIFVSVWFMWRIEKRFDRFTEMIHTLVTTVAVMTKTMDTWSSNGRPMAIDDRASGGTKAP